MFYNSYLQAILLQTINESTDSASIRQIIKERTHKDNFAQVLIYYEELNLETISEIPAYEVCHKFSTIY